MQEWEWRPDRKVIVGKYTIILSIRHTILVLEYPTCFRAPREDMNHVANHEGVADGRHLVLFFKMATISAGRS